MKHIPLLNIGRILLLAVTTAFSAVHAGTLIIDSSFEEVTGLTGSQEPVDNYIFATSYESYWLAHIAGTEVISNCDGRRAYDGNYYWHLNFYTGATDPCLGTRPTSVNSHSNVGVDRAYPTGAQYQRDLTQATLSDTITIRFYFRVTGNWTSSNGTDGGGGLKFIRVYGNGPSGDNSAALLKYRNDGDSTDPRWYVYDPGRSPHYSNVSTGINTQDGEWHSIAYKVRINNTNNTSGNIDTTFWVDDWNMRGPGYSTTITASTFGSDFRSIELFANWSADPVDDDMGIDIDKFEVWDGTPFPPPAPPTLQ
jgi:hypothetical protein